MSDAIAFAWAFAAGGLLGGVFFGGLWWTVRRGVSAQRPALWFLGSLLLRTSVALTGFYLVGADHWQRLVVCLVGFVMAQLAVTWLARSRSDDAARAPREARHAP